MKKFSWDNDGFDRRFNFMWNLAVGWIVFCMVAVVLYLGAIIYGATIGLTYVNEHGIKDVIETIYCGKDGCKE